MSIHSGDKGHAGKFATSGTDAQLIVWDMKVRERDFCLSVHSYLDIHILKFPRDIIIRLPTYNSM